MSNVRPEATTDEIVQSMRDIRAEMTRNRDVDLAAELGAGLADLVKELDERLTAGGPLPTVWSKATR